MASESFSFTSDPFWSVPAADAPDSPLAGAALLARTADAPTRSAAPNLESPISSWDIPKRKTLVIAIDGAGGENAGDNPRFRQFARELGAATLYDGQALSLDGTVKQALTDVKQFHRDNPEGRIVLLGYSAGGHDAIELANRLGREKIGVHTLVTFDPHRKNFIGYKDYILTESNVENPINFYQRNPVELRHRSNPFRGSPVKNATNYDLTGWDVTHVNIVEKSLDDAKIKTILPSALNR